MRSAMETLRKRAMQIIHVYYQHGYGTGSIAPSLSGWLDTAIGEPMKIPQQASDINPSDSVATRQSCHAPVGATAP